MKTFSINIFFLLMPFFIHSQVIHDLDQSVIIEASINKTESFIQLKWTKDDNAQSYNIYRKLPSSTFWGFTLATLPPDSLSWKDTNVEAGVLYEYRIEKVLSGLNSNGYIYSGIHLPPKHYRGMCILAIDSSFKLSLELEINRLINDMENEGWKVLTLYCSEHDSPPELRDRIINIYNEHPNESFYSLLLLGRIPIPYSGNIFPDGHPDHQGAWPADGYYGSMTGNWTDQTVNITVASDPRNHNVPGDGKFDQSTFPGLLQKAVGRVDFHDLPAFDKSDEELLRNYLDKNHLWRSGRISSIERGLVHNNFGGISEGFGQNGHKNFSVMFGIDSVHVLPYRSTLRNESYLWSYGAGPGNPSNAGGIISTSNLSTDSIQSVFTILFGSYFGDWGYTNNLLRAALASGTVLTNVWAGRPNWQFHHMGMGKPIGYSVLKSKNNNSIYQTGFFPRGVHMALMGDPTLTMYVSRPPEDIHISQVNDTLKISWTSVSASEGYYLYSRQKGDQSYTLIKEDKITDTFFLKICPPPGEFEYKVRSSELRTTASGTFYHLSPGISSTFEAHLGDLLPTSDFEYELFYDLLTLENNSSGATHFLWNFGDGTTDSLPSPVYLFDSSGVLDICLQAFNSCYKDKVCQEIEVINSMPFVEAEKEDISCHGNLDGNISIKLLDGASNPVLNWSNKGEGTDISDLSSGLYYLTISTITGKEEEFGPWVISEPDSLVLEFFPTYPDDSENNGNIITSITGGTPPYSYLWSTGDTQSNIDQLIAGLYCLTISDQNGCEIEKCYLLDATSVSDFDGNFNMIVFPNPAKEVIVLQWNIPMDKSTGLQIHNNKGELMKTIQLTASSNFKKINIADFPSGIYHISIELEAKRHIYSITKIE
ncbi:MAG: T9SS C-terminal target domain-containing protein [Saprospirales bacterium]|nr:MAG: T9SS C-terminal target domain-containing protein [Saprospirales bacterium]